MSLGVGVHFDEWTETRRRWGDGDKDKVGDKGNEEDGGGMRMGLTGEAERRRMNFLRKGWIMARYVTLLRFTDTGAKGIGKSVSRAAAFRKSVEKAGLVVEEQLWTVGAWDGVLILSGDEKEILRALTELNAAGNVRTESMLAFDASEMKEL